MLFPQLLWHCTMRSLFKYKVVVLFQCSMVILKQVGLHQKLMFLLIYSMSHIPNHKCTIHKLCVQCTGKSTAAKCALALFGQHRVGNIMKTKAPSESICAERIANSTLPFILDDTKSPETCRKAYESQEVSLYSAAILL